MLLTSENLRIMLRLVICAPPGDDAGSLVCAAEGVAE
jgi:hypothetical protein